MEKQFAIVSFINIAQDANLLNSVISAAQTALAHEDATDRYLNVILTDDEFVHNYNLQYRGVDRTTDVLSFPADEGDFLAAPPDGFLGDIVISVPKADEQAKVLGHSVEREILFLTVHGILHLLGYDHMTPEDEDVMLPIQREIVNSID